MPYTFGKKDDKSKNYDKPDLIINYSFGHKNSTVLLTPYGGMVNYINHAPSADRVPGAEPTANVKVQWPKRELIAHKPWWLNKDTAFLRDTTEKIGLSFEYVALRDIKEGEEVFMVSVCQCIIETFMSAQICTLQSLLCHVQRTMV